MTHALANARIPKLSVVVPVHNEAPNIAPLVREIHDALAGGDPYEIIYVDDGSNDGTLEELVSLMGRFPGLRVFRHALNCGQSTALLTGIRAARAPVIATLDGDGQNDPGDIPRLLGMLEDPNRPEGLQMVAGLRRKRRDTPWRRLSSRIANSVRRKFLKDDTPDTGCGLKVFYRDTFMELPHFDHMHRFLPALVKRAGGTTLSVAVRHRPRVRGESHYGTLNRLRAGLVDMLGVMWLQRRVRLTDITEYLPGGGTPSPSGGEMKRLEDASGPVPPKTGESRARE
ncbi:MAG: dolichol-phosphate mannosyltransferase [Deltaproteobacteria bacterium]|nr:MAG: dolichol-phosphate mannosyltransferase [Deltaproteobacteria bacterium]